MWLISNRPKWLPFKSALTCVLILGTLPGNESLRQGRYYADPTNHFWSIMNTLFGIPRWDYDGLLKNRIALWDVLAEGVRTGGSGDKHIVPGTERVNKFAKFFRKYSSITDVFFNNQQAEDYFPNIPNHPRLHHFLPSSSGGNRSYPSVASKIPRWTAVKVALDRKRIE